MASCSPAICSICSAASGSPDIKTDISLSFTIVCRSVSFSGTLTPSMHCGMAWQLRSQAAGGGQSPMASAVQRLALFAFDEQYIRQLQEQVTEIEDHFAA